MLTDDHKKKLHGLMKDEIGDYNSKTALAAEMVKADEMYTAKVLMLAAKDEESHARYLRGVLLDSGYQIPTADEQAYQAMETHFHRAHT